jgi:vacuolar-type H+-ATPase subunit E/Vma4
MSHFRRRRSSGPDDEHGTPKDPNATTQRFTPYSLGATGGDPPTETQPGSSSPRSEPETRIVESASESPNDPAAYERLGEHVSTVLSSADEAAKRLQASATKEAERIRGEAEDYARKTRAAADSYAEQRRENAETEASAITADAEKRAREARNAAEEQATDIQRDAIRRRESLLRESEHSEERLQNLLKVFRAMTERLENLVSASDAPSTEKAEAPVDDDLTEALAKSRGSVVSRPGGSRARG